MEQINPAAGQENTDFLRTFNLNTLSVISVSTRILRTRVHDENTTEFRIFLGGRSGWQDSG